MSKDNSEVLTACLFDILSLQIIDLCVFSVHPLSISAWHELWDDFFAQSNYRSNIQARKINKVAFHYEFVSFFKDRD